MKSAIFSFGIVLASFAQGAYDVTTTEITSEVERVICYDSMKMIVDLNIKSTSAKVVAESYLQQDYHGTTSRKTDKIKLFANNKSAMQISISTEDNFQFRSLEEKIEETLRTSEVRLADSSIKVNGQFLRFNNLACTVTLNKSK